jgi:hypothetical protein
VTARPRLTLPRAIFGVATLLGLFSTFQATQWLRILYPNEHTSLWLLFGVNLGYWYAWALLAPLVLWPDGSRWSGGCGCDRCRSTSSPSS